MTPTAHLRLVWRAVPVSIDTARMEKVLQQWWEDRSLTLAVLQYDKYGTPITSHPGEWRDVPLEKE